MQSAEKIIPYQSGNWRKNPWKLANLVASRLPRKRRGEPDYRGVTSSDSLRQEFGYELMRVITRLDPDKADSMVQRVRAQLRRRDQEWGVGMLEVTVTPQVENKFSGKSWMGMGEGARYERLATDVDGFHPVVQVFAPIPRGAPSSIIALPKMERSQKVFVVGDSSEIFLRNEEDEPLGTCYSDGTDAVFTLSHNTGIAIRMLITDEEKLRNSRDIRPLAVEDELHRSDRKYPGFVIVRSASALI